MANSSQLTGIVQIHYTACPKCFSRETHNSVCLKKWRKTLKPPKLNKTQRTIIEDAITAMLSHPETVDMGIWVSHDHEDNKPKPEEENGYCGTTACLAGHLALAAGLPPVESIRARHLALPTASKARRAKVGTGHVSAIARRILNLEKKEQTRVFLSDDWPLRFARQYENATTPRARARVTAARLQHYLDTGE